MTSVNSRKVVASILQDPISAEYLIEHMIENPVFTDMLYKKILDDKNFISDLMKEMTYLVDSLDHTLIATTCTRQN